MKMDTKMKEIITYVRENRLQHESYGWPVAFLAVLTDEVERLDRENAELKLKPVDCLIISKAFSEGAIWHNLHFSADRLALDKASRKYAEYANRR